MKRHRKQQQSRKKWPGKKPSIEFHRSIVELANQGYRKVGEADRHGRKGMLVSNASTIGHSDTPTARPTTKFVAWNGDVTDEPDLGRAESKDIAADILWQSAAYCLTDE